MSINRHYREIMDRDKSESLIIKEFGLRLCAILSFTGQQDLFEWIGKNVIEPEHSMMCEVEDDFEK